MKFFVRLTLSIALIFAALCVVLFVLKLVAAAAVVAVVALAALFAFNFVRAFARRMATRRSVGVLPR
ncbi:MAG: hypothetical protein IAI50_04655 [Candidatus Eremiobacteraeota bacterium]|nr:hypothetical protein [Candidatus Eremiobacteraeota bacterium]